MFKTPGIPMSADESPLFRSKQNGRIYSNSPRHYPRLRYHWAKIEDFKKTVRVTQVNMR